MKIKLFRSATVGINSKNFKLLTDPWLTDGEYYGSWSHYPSYNLDKNLEEINNYDAIYISHIHPDHCSEQTLRKISKSIPIYIHKYHSPFLKLKIERMGFIVHEVDNGKTIYLNKDLRLTIYAADDCDPALCYKFLGCANLSKENGSQQIDSISVISSDRYTIVNTNDCPFELSKNVLNKIKKKFKSIDVLLTGYGGAGPYPQCVDNFSFEQKKIEAKKKEINFLDKTLEYLKILHPKYYLPFAGTYTLSGKLSKLQSLRGVPTIDDAYNYLDKEISRLKEIEDIKSIKLNPGNEFNIEVEKSDKPFIKFDHLDFENYVSKKLIKKKFFYENNEKVSFNEILSMAKVAYSRFLNKQKELNIKLDTDIILEVLDKYIVIPYNKEELKTLDKVEFKENEKFVIYKLDIRLLKLILMGPRYAHWNNAEIGSHINFYRKPNIYDRKLYFNMNYFHI
tara:strand:- start:600 stop:1955 length:1356 start_codon:yes stop_codon:yes gene_type:complete